MESQIMVRDVVFHYPGQSEPALNGLSLDVYKGEWLAIVGHNGSGKSTLTKLWNGLLIPEQGEVRVETLDPSNATDVWDVRTRIGVVFQNPDNQFVGATVRDDVAFSLENMGLPRQEMVRRIDDSLARVGLSELADREPHQLSGGQKQRVAIAAALAMRPRVLVLDEATSMLDPIGRQEVLQTVRQLVSEGMTVVAITHELDEVLFADRIIALSKGKIAMTGTPEDVFQHPDTLRDIQLDVPFIVRMQLELKARGIPLDRLMLQHSELVNHLCRYALKK
ncbi:energy-coupling factor transporter ATPase [Exiguobacterium sp. N5]|uniref:energy-coupling factor transporter ATPase n=1 Tax=Exiguobacterium sp. N5 TaxID=2990450 RepID=UPI0021F3F3F9|nr:energy-coupling factor transporter ATPase [Exiguobacterium sp. N5]MCV9901361.1 energy-coupling factor transporter ATPase [Exiguobacterium sp. N5]